MASFVRSFADHFYLYLVWLLHAARGWGNLNFKWPASRFLSLSVFLSLSQFHLDLDGADAAAAAAVASFLC